MTLRPTVCAALLAGVLPLAAAAQSIDHGPDMPLGAGTVRAFAETDAAGRPPCQPAPSSTSMA